MLRFGLRCQGPMCGGLVSGTRDMCRGLVSGVRDLCVEVWSQVLWTYVLRFGLRCKGPMC